MCFVHTHAHASVSEGKTIAVNNFKIHSTQTGWKAEDEKHHKDIHSEYEMHAEVERSTLTCTNSPPEHMLPFMFTRTNPPPKCMLPFLREDDNHQKQVIDRDHMFLHL